MNFKGNIILRAALGVYTGTCLLCSITMARDVPGTSKIKLNSVPVYSRADIDSAKVNAINRNEVFTIQMVVDDGTDRWCAIVDSRKVFVGYVLCDQLKAQKSRFPRARHVRPVVKKSMPDTSSVIAPPDNAENILKSDADRGGYGTVTSGKGKAVGSAKQAGKDAGAVGNKKINFSIIWLTFAAVFIVIVLTIYLIYIFAIRNVLRRIHLAPAESQETDSLHETAESTAGSTMVHETTGEPVTVDRAEEVKSGIEKGEASPIGTLVKCQLCGTVQILEIDAKCINCRATITKDITPKSD